MDGQEVPEPLHHLELPRVLVTSEHDFTKDFFEPLLKRSQRYDRAVGFLSSTWFSVNADGLASFFGRGGHARWLTSPILSERDWKTIVFGAKARVDPDLRQSVEDAVSDLRKALQEDCLSALALLIARGTINIRLALPQGRLSGDFHDKFGVFQDPEGNLVGYSGSYNDSARGAANYESIATFGCVHSESSEHGEQMASRLQQRFDYIWSDEDPNLRIYGPLEALKEDILQIRSREPTSRSPRAQRTTNRAQGEHSMAEPSIPPHIDLRPYQKDARRAWFEADGRGIFKMATGTGKTITALGTTVSLLEAMRQQDQSLGIIVVCPYRHLVTQWANEAEVFGFSPIKCFESWTTWYEDLNSAITACNTGATSNFMAITTNATFQTDRFQSVIQALNTPSLLIGDEVHNLGSTNLLQALPEAIPYRLGLSATPERWFDEEGTQALFGYFGPSVYEMGLEEAIDNRYLTPYEYHPILVDLTAEELEEYLDLSAAIAQRFGQSEAEDPEEDEVLKRLLLKRARITATAENKLSVLEDLIGDRSDQKHMLVYCGTGQVETGPDEAEKRQIDAVVELLGRKLGMRVAPYVAETHIDERAQLRDDFEKGKLQGLVAIRCLDEGVDIPATRSAYILASTSNPRQWIQRRGRILRQAGGKDRAAIWDLVVIPPADSLSSDEFNIERKMVQKELKRVDRFAALAENGPQAQAKLIDVKKTYNLMGM